MEMFLLVSRYFAQLRFSDLVLFFARGFVCGTEGNIVCFLSRKSSKKRKKVSSENAHELSRVKSKNIIKYKFYYFVALAME